MRTKPFQKRRHGHTPFAQKTSERPFARPQGRTPGAFKRRSAPRSARKTKGADIDPALFVRKAILTTESEPFNPEHRFADFAIHDHIKKTIYKRGFSHPTPIQDGAIPHVLKGRDLIGIANTGTGKTAAFLIPLIDKCFRNRSERVLIMAPTRELANQIEAEWQDFSVGTGLKSAICIGGAHLDRQVKALRQNPAFVIGTPGRLKDLADRKDLVLAPFNNVVLDEVDRMLDMGFIQDMKYLLAMVRTKRQTLFFSATMPKPIAELAQKFLTDPITITIKSRATAENVEQNVISTTSPAHKMETLHDLLLKEGFTKVLIFRRTKRGADRLAKMLGASGFKADSIHGDKSQSQRERALRRFKQDELQVLVATDVAARGLDIPDVTHVFNYDLPETYEDYIHRIGRTGRASKSGFALTFLDEFDEKS
jgi:superfamily II DNA/RNA helicase